MDALLMWIFMVDFLILMSGFDIVWTLLILLFQILNLLG